MTDISPELVSRLLRQHGPALVLYAQQRCDTAEDVVQEAFLKLVQQPQAPDRPLAWLYRVVRNAALNAARAASRRGRNEAQAAHRGEPWFESDVQQSLDGRAAVAALKSLPVEEREVVVARVWGGLAFEELADLVGVSTSTAYRRYLSGLEQLRRQLERSGTNSDVTQPQNRESGHGSF